MRNYLFLSLSLLFLPMLGKALIIETAHIADAIPFIDENTWFLVDLDNTMFEAQQALGHANWFYDEIQQRMQEGMSREQAICDAYPLWIKTQQICPVKPLEKEFVPSLLLLQNQEIVIMGLTHRQPSVAEATIGQIASLGFDFENTAPSRASFAVPAANPALYEKGILFVGDSNKKGDVFLPFLSILAERPKKVVFIDDKRKNVEELGEALSRHGIDYIGIHYTAIEHAPPVYSRKLAAFQSKFLERMLSNEEAALLMEEEAAQRIPM